ncbi:hypothetical protein TNCV_3033371 [Trichonephila clavipes]|nr:hypothetical protein TNCV_3033371 [Trichonephila clavipes]
MDERILDAFKQIRCAGNVSCNDDDPCSRRRLYLSDFRLSQKKKFTGFKSGERGGQATCLPHSIHISGYVAEK